MKKLLLSLFSFFLLININHAQDEIFHVVEDLPMFPGCEEVSKMERKKCADKKLLEYVYANLEYPQIALDNGVEGTVVISFVVQPDGTLAEAKVLRDIGARCGLAAKKVVDSMNASGIIWVPGTQRGQPVKVRFNLPVKFKLPEEVMVEEVVEEHEEVIEMEEDEEMPEFIDLDIEEDEEMIQPLNPENKIYKEVDEMPRFPGCENVSDAEERQSCADRKMLIYIYSNLKYPPLARENGIEGTVMVSFIVKPDGSLSDVKITKDIGGGCGEAVIEVYKKMAAKFIWIPGKLKGVPVSVEYNIPVKFSLG